VARRRNEGLAEQFAVARAAGMTTAEWCGRHGVAVSTANGWARLPWFRPRVQSLRMSLVGRELDLLAAHAVLRATRDDPPRPPLSTAGSGKGSGKGLTVRLATPDPPEAA
jgi:hypothetical protein